MSNLDQLSQPTTFRIHHELLSFIKDANSPRPLFINHEHSPLHESPLFSHPLWWRNIHSSFVPRWIFDVWGSGSGHVRSYIPTHVFSFGCIFLAGTGTLNSRHVASHGSDALVFMKILVNCYVDICNRSRLVMELNILTKFTFAAVVYSEDVSWECLRCHACASGTFPLHWDCVKRER